LSDDLGARAARPATTALAIVCVVGWLVASAGAGPFGIWIALGGASIVLGAAVFVLDRAAARPPGAFGLLLLIEFFAGTWLLSAWCFRKAARA